MSHKELIQNSQNAIAEAMLHFHLQLQACFRGDREAANQSHEAATEATARAIVFARKVMGL